MSLSFVLWEFASQLRTASSYFVQPVDLWQPGLFSTPITDRVRPSNAVFSVLLPCSCARIDSSINKDNFGSQGAPIPRLDTGPVPEYAALKPQAFCQGANMSPLKFVHFPKSSYNPSAGGPVTRAFTTCPSFQSCAASVSFSSSIFPKYAIRIRADLGTSASDWTLLANVPTV